FGYSNTNTVLLGQVIQAVTGQSWIQQIQSRLLTPLQLSSVVYPPEEPLGPALAAAYQSTDDGIEAIGTGSDTLYSAAGGLFGDIGDLLSWGTALGSGVLLPATLQTARLSPVSSAQTGNFTPAYDAYGLAMGELDGWWGHTGVGSGYESLVMYDPASKSTLAILINTALADPNAAAALFRQLVPELGAL
ncbi:MAG TPA: serine hydrolase domain-containing protein, partial [Micrococcaceae bacterium]